MQVIRAQNAQDIFFTGSVNLFLELMKWWYCKHC